MTQLRSGQKPDNLTNGPAKLTQALAITRELNGHDLALWPLKLIIKPPLASSNIVQTKRIGISAAQDLKLRFYIKDNPYLSQKVKIVA